MRRSSTTGCALSLMASSPRNTAAVRRSASIRRSSKKVRLRCRANSCSWIAPRSGLAPSFCICAPSLITTSCSTRRSRIFRLIASPSGRRLSLPRWGCRPHNSPTGIATPGVDGPYRTHDGVLQKHSRMIPKSGSRFSGKIMRKRTIGEDAMNASRRNLIQAIAAGGAAIAATQVPTGALAQSTVTQATPTSPAPASSAAATVDLGDASNQERELKVVNIELLEDDARKIISPGRFAVMGPAGDGWTYRENRRAFNDFPIMPRRLQGVSDIDLRTRLLDHDLPFPMITAPMGAQGMIHAEAEVANAGGTGMAGTLYVSSGAATKKMEDIAQATPGPKWFQIYMNKDPEINRWLVQRAKAAGFSAIVLTADALGPGASDDFIRLGRPFPPELRLPGNHDPAQGGHGNFFNMKRDLNYADIGFLHQASGLPVVVKGLLSVEDIRQSVAAGAAAIWVSNHGGRQMDGVPATISLLRPAVDTVQDRVPIIVDSGIRRGIDVFKALALGAKAVAIGRPVLWGMAVGGASGVKSVYAHLADELRSAMLLSGVAKIADITRKYVILKV